MYLNVEGESFDIDSNAPVGIRDSRYKLLHAYTNNSQAEWYDIGRELDDDASLFSTTSCPQFQTLTGEYTKFLFDLKEDPNEEVNLYLDRNYDGVKVRFFFCIGLSRTNAEMYRKTCTSSWRSSRRR
jgi:hypothetical protein